MSYQSVKSKADQFLACKVIAVVGVSSNPQEAANANYYKLKNVGYTVVPINPNHDVFDGMKCYPNVVSAPNGVEAALIFTHPSVTPKVVEDCLTAGIKHIWIHQGMGPGSRSPLASDSIGKYANVNFIDGACPMMFIEGADIFHKCFGKILGWTGRLPA